jgi:hypothetical protein
MYVLFTVHGSWFMVQGLGRRVEGFWFKVCGIEFMVQGLGRAEPHLNSGLTIQGL